MIGIENGQRPRWPPCRIATHMPAPTLVAVVGGHGDVVVAPVFFGDLLGQAKVHADLGRVAAGG